MTIKPYSCSTCAPKQAPVKEAQLAVDSKHLLQLQDFMKPSLERTPGKDTNKQTKQITTWQMTQIRNHLFKCPVNFCNIINFTIKVGTSQIWEAELFTSQPFSTVKPYSRLSGEGDHESGDQRLEDLLTEI